MADLARDLRLAVDTGKAVFGVKEVAKAINSNSAKLVVVATQGKKDAIVDVIHNCNVASVKVLKYDSGSLSLGTVCGKPYSINALAIIEAGNSNILNETYIGV